MPDKINQMINHAQIAWDEFMDSDTESSTIRPLIMESWKRCRTHRVDPYKTISKRLPDKLYEETLKENKTLIQVAKPIMDGLLGIVKDSSYAIILTDAQGVILDMIWSIQGMDHISELNFMKGCRWTEDSVGTNAIGTALHLKAPVQTLGAEHYCIDQHMWTCSAAPIKNEKGEVIGIIDLSGNFIDYHPHTLAMVVAAASSISNQIQLIENRKWVDTAYDLIQEGILILDSHLVIKDYNKALSSILEVTMHEIEGLNIPEFLQDIECNFDLKKIQEPIELDEVALHVNKRRKEFGVTMSPVLENGKFLGLVLSIRKTEKIRSVVNRVIGNTSSYDFPDIVTQDHEMLTIIESAKRIAQTKSTVLIHGESGTGKELFAHAIHKNSLFSDGPFVAVNCGALPQDLIESELFGYEKGAFTGASKSGKPGKFEIADGGTIFLDEIGEMPLSVQSKLLRVLDNNTITRIGGTFERKLNIRIITATNRNLLNEVQQKNFRHDLFYRINVIKLTIPALRFRGEDILLCANFFLNRLNKSYDGKDKHFSALYKLGLKEHDWPGNLRELQNYVERSYILSEGLEIEIDSTSQLTKKESHLDRNNEEDTDNSNGNTLTVPVKTLAEMEKGLLLQALNETHGNVVKASRLINIGKSTFYRKLKEYQLDPSQYGK